MSETPDWSQFATKDDLSHLESRLIRWMVGIYLTFLVLLAGLVALALNPIAVARTLHNLLQNF